MEPILCPYCGGSELIEVEEETLETEEEYWVISNWKCTDCHEHFQRISRTPLSEAFEDEEDEERRWS